MPNISFETLVSYLEDIAEKHVDIKSHFRWNIAEIQGAMRSGIEDPLMAIDSPEISTSGDRAKRFHYNSMAFTILAKPDDQRGVDKYLEQNKVLNACLQICFDIEKRIVADSATRMKSGQKNWMYNLLDINSFNFLKVGPIFTNGYYGYRCEFLIKNSYAIHINENKWSDLNNGSGYPYTYPFILS